MPDIICISDEAHRTQTNVTGKNKRTKDEIKKKYGFARYLHDSLPNATYVGFTGTPIDATLEVFGKVVDAYTMMEMLMYVNRVLPVLGRGRRITRKNFCPDHALLVQFG